MDSAVKSAQNFGDHSDLNIPAVNDTFRELMHEGLNPIYQNDTDREIQDFEDDCKERCKK